MIPNTSFVIRPLERSTEFPIIGRPAKKIPATLGEEEFNGLSPITKGKMMKKRTVITLIVASVLSIPAMADDAQLAKESETVVAHTVKLLLTNPQAVIDDINTSDKKWFTGGGEVYPIINSIDGMSLANAQNPKTVGKDVNAMIDMNGKEIVKERIELAKSKGKFWYEYAWRDPVSKKVLPKKTYCERAGKSGEYIVCAGYYKR